MADSNRLVWDETGKRFYETGSKQGVLYLQDETGKYGTGVAWNGLSKVTESPDGAEESPIYADDQTYLSLVSAENEKGTIEAYTYPDDFAKADGSSTPVAGVTVGQQTRRAFGFSWRTIKGNDTANEDYGYKLHIVWNAKVQPSEREYESVNDSPSAITFSWDFTTTPVPVSAKDADGTSIKPTSVMTLDSTIVGDEGMKAVEDLLYGTDEKEASLPTIDEVINAVKSASKPNPGK